MNMLTMYGKAESSATKLTSVFGNCWFTKCRCRVAAFSLHIREVPILNLGPETGYSDRGFSWFSSVLPGKSRDSALN
jgi:hypothetical protein